MGIGGISGIGQFYYNNSISPSEGNKGSQELKTGKVSPSECQTCKNRKYVDGSNEMNVSFKSATHVSPQSSGSAVRAHENEHVTNAYNKASKNGGRVLSAYVTLESAVCPECGTSYISGGVTHTSISTPVDKNQNKNPYINNKPTGNFFDLSV